MNEELTLNTKQFHLLPTSTLHITDQQILWELPQLNIVLLSLLLLPEERYDKRRKAKQKRMEYNTSIWKTYALPLTDTIKSVRTSFLYNRKLPVKSEILGFSNNVASRLAPRLVNIRFKSHPATYKINFRPMLQVVSINLDLLLHPGHILFQLPRHNCLPFAF